MAGLDVICIGAVNYDYMFHCTSFDLIVTEKEGSEDLNDGLSDVEGDIYELVMKGKEYTTQIGGSAFITLKVTKHILRDLKVAYVGACGTPNSFDLRYGKTNDLDTELSAFIITAETVLRSHRVPITHCWIASGKKKNGPENLSQNIYLRHAGFTYPPCLRLISLK